MRLELTSESVSFSGFVASWERACDAAAPGFREKTGTFSRRFLSMIRVLQDKRFFFLFVIALIFSLSKSAFATTYVMPTDDQLVIGSRAIVRGRVLAVESAFDRQTGRVWTYTTLRLNEVLKGNITQRKIVIKEEGGQTSERGSIVFGTPQFKVNEQVILYLDTWGDGSLRVHDMFLGKFTVTTDAQS